MNAPQLPPEAAAIEALGHLKQKVCLMWGSAELDIFISRLIMDSRDGQRQGLPVAAAAELLFLAQTNKIIRAIALLSHQSVTLKEAYRLVDEGDQKRLEADALDNPMVSRDTITQGSGDDSDRRLSERRSGGERRQSVRADGATASLGEVIFKLIFSKAFIFLIVFAMTIKLLWPYFKGGAGT